MMDSQFPALIGNDVMCIDPPINNTPTGHAPKEIDDA
jgi:hypothetical protein